MWQESPWKSSTSPARCKPQPDVGTDVFLHYPAGRPDLARISRPKAWIAIYAMLLATLALLFVELAKA